MNMSILRYQLLGLPSAWSKDLLEKMTLAQVVKKLTNSMEQSPSSEANTHSTGQEIPYLSLNPKVHYRIHKDAQLVSVISLKNSVHTFPPYFHNIHFNIIFPSMPISSVVPSLQVFRLKFCRHFHLSNATYMSHPHQPPRFDHPNNIW
jgi:hypothetical protein